jgi:hypothetical protein
VAVLVTNTLEVSVMPRAVVSVPEAIAPVGTTLEISVMVTAAVSFVSIVLKNELVSAMLMEPVSTVVVNLLTLLVSLILIDAVSSGELPDRVSISAAATDTKSVALRVTKVTAWSVTLTAAPSLPAAIALPPVLDASVTETLPVSEATAVMFPEETSAIEIEPVSVLGIVLVLALTSAAETAPVSVVLNVAV